MKLVLLSLSFFFAITGATAQHTTNQNKIWAFGKNAGLDFTSGSPLPITTAINQQEGCASVCSPEGGLLFYTDGRKVYNRTGAIMPSGGNIVSFSINSTSQSSVVVPVIGSTSRYYIFSLEQSLGDSTGHLAYSIVNMALDGGLGDVEAATMSTPIEDSLGEKMIAITGNNNNIWLLVHRKDTSIFLAYEINASGINTSPVVSVTGTLSDWLGYAIGVIKVSPNRRKLVSQTYAYSTISPEGTELYDFDPTTGMVSNCVVLDSLSNQYGAAFSPDNSKLYVQQQMSSNVMKIFQYDVALPGADAIRASKVAVAKITTANVTDLRLGPDGKIYMFGTDDSTKNLFLGYSRFLDCISTPNLPGTLCGYVPHAVKLVNGTGVRAGLPNIYVTADTASYITDVSTPVSILRVNIFPNPAVRELTVTAPERITHISICNLVGQEVYTSQHNSTTVNVDISALPASVYFIRVNGVAVRRFVRQ